MFNDRATNPLIASFESRNWLADVSYGVLSTTAGRRNIFIRYPEPQGKSAEVCAEPPPDAIDSYANALSVAARAGGGGSGAPSGELGRALAVNSAPALYRSQGLQLLRDQEFALCIMRLRNDIDSKQYVDLRREVLRHAVRLTMAEMGAIKAAAGRAPVTVVAPVLPDVRAPAPRTSTADASGGAAR